VILENGCGPIREQVRIDVPIFVAKVSYVGAAFPRLVFQTNQLPTLNIRTSDTNENTVLLASMDSVVGLDFRNELPAIITKTLASTVAKAAASYAVNEAANRSDSTLGVVAQIATAIYGLSVNVADTRTWTTLPKELQYCRIPTPADRRIELSGPSGRPSSVVTVGEGMVNVVYVRSITASDSLRVSQMRLR
jgi:hypothetical protein